MAEVNEETPYANKERVTKYHENVTQEPCNIFCTDYVLWSKLLTRESVQGASIFVLPCGTGRNIRRLEKLGASRIEASDLSPACIEYCQTEDASKVEGDPGFDTPRVYRVHDAGSPDPIRLFPQNDPADISLIVHLFCFAQDRATLLSMCRCVAMNTRPGGRLISYSCAAWDAAKNKSTYEETCGVSDVKYQPGVPDQCQYMWNGEAMKTFNWPLETLVGCLEEAGFGSLQIIPADVSPEYDGHLELANFSELTNYKFIVAVRGQ